MIRIEGYLPVADALWMWRDEVAERLVEVQEYWLARNCLTGTYNDAPHYGVILDTVESRKELVIQARIQAFMSASIRGR